MPWILKGLRDFTPALLVIFLKNLLVILNSSLMPIIMELFKCTDSKKRNYFSLALRMS
jgi:hypothetical protein